MTNEQIALKCVLICLDHGSQTAAYQIQEEFRVSNQDVANMTYGEGRLPETLTVCPPELGLKLVGPPIPKSGHRGGW